MDDEILVTDVTAEMIGERREEWRAGFDAGLKAGSQRVLQSAALEAIALELTLLRAAAEKLGAKADYWMRKADELELEAEKWHSIVASSWREAA